jgi:hypothetical protein
MPRAAGLLALLVAMLLATVAWASDPGLTVSIDADTVGLGDVLHVTLQAQSSSETPSDPQLGSTGGGFSVVGISPSTSTSMNIMNGAVTSLHGLTTVWSLRATKVGVFTIGPPTVAVGGKRYRSSQSVTLRVVAAGQAPHRQPQRPQDPFDPFSGLFGQLQQQLGQQMGQLPGLEPQQPDREQIQVDPRFALPAPRGQMAFLHAVVDKTSVVVGEQVTYSVYLYADGRHDLDVNDPHEAPASDFVKRSLQTDETKIERVGYASVGGDVYVVQLVRKAALFPLKAGDLDVGAMSLVINVGKQGGGARDSEDLHVRVSEPPVAGRPAGYAVGDVGKMALSADVSGRDVEQEGAIGVTAVLSGTGNLPTTIEPPERAGVEWLDPQVTEKFKPPYPGDRYGGSRTFQYVVRLHKPGDLDLGTLTLPYWDAQARAYGVAQVALGTVRVKPGTSAPAQADAPNDPLPGLPAALTKREPATGSRRHWTDAPAYWLGLGAMPLTYGLVVAASGTMQRMKAKRAARSASPKTAMQARVSAAESASRAEDPEAMDAATARALEATLVAETSVNVRALATSEIGSALASAGVREETAREVEAILLECEAARFSASDTGASEARQRWTRARVAIDQLAGRA